MPCSISATVVAFNRFSMRVPLASRCAWVSLANIWSLRSFLPLFNFLVLVFGLGVGVGLGVGAATKRSRTSMAELSREMWPIHWPENVERIRASCAAASQLGVGELGESAGEGRFMGYLAGMGPAAEPAKCGVVSQGFEQLAGVDEAVHTLGKEGAGDGLPVFAGAAVPAARWQEFGDGNHGADGDEERAAIGDRAQDGFQTGEEFLLQDVGELGELSEEVVIHEVWRPPMKRRCFWL